MKQIFGTVILILMPVVLAAQNAAMEGTVVNHASGQPIQGAHVTLLSGDLTSGFGVEHAFGAITDRTGHFAIENIVPGAFLLFVRYTGFIQTRGPGGLQATLLSLKPGQRMAGMKIEMDQGAVLTGRVLDEFGDPVQYVDIALRGVPPAPDPSQGSLFGGTTAPTDEKGEFRLFTSPGRFYVLAQPRSARTAPEIRTDGSSTAPVIGTYYPSSADRDRASVVEVGAGQSVGGLDIRMVRAAAPGPAPGSRPLTISGAVSGMAENGRPMVTLRYGDTAASLNSSRTTSIDNDGKFSVAGLEPKHYRVYAEDTTSKIPLRSQTVELDLAGADVAGLQLALAPGDEISASLELSGGAGAAPKISLSLEAMDWNAKSIGIEEKNGAFRLPNLFAGRYRLRVEPLPENAYIKEVTLDGKAVKDNVLDLSGGARGSRLKVSVALDGGRISGKLLGHDGQPLVSVVAVVMLWRDGPSANPDSQRVTRDYIFKGVKPGKLLMLALDATEFLDLHPADPAALLKTLTAAAEPVEVKENGRVEKDLKVVEQEKINGGAH